MEPFSIILIFVVAWWLCFFIVLPIGVHSQEETGEVVQGTEPGAPTAPMLKKKAIWATIGGAIVTGAAAIIITVLAN